MPTKKTTPADEVDAPVGVTEDTFDLLDWIESGTVARRTVTIYNNPALVTEYHELQARLEDLGYDEDEEARAERAQDAALGDGNGKEIQELLGRMEDLYERWQASKALWTVRAVSRDEMEAAFEEVPDPKMPVPPGDNAPARLREDFATSVHEYGKAKRKADEERTLVLLATSVISIETPRGTADSVTVEQLRRLRSRPHGEQWITLLSEAMEAATENDVEIPRPTSSGRSETSQG